MYENDPDFEEALDLSGPSDTRQFVDYADETAQGFPDNFDDIPAHDLSDLDDLEMWVAVTRQGDADPEELTAEEKIDQMMRRLRSMRRHVERTQHRADLERTATEYRIARWEAARLGDVPQRIIQTEEAIGEAVRALVANRKEKSVSTPSGLVSTRSTRSWQWVDDKDLIMKTAVALGVGPGHPAWIPADAKVIPAKVDLAEFKKSLKALDDGTVVSVDGEVVPVVRAPFVTKVEIELEKS